MSNPIDLLRAAAQDVVLPDAKHDEGGAPAAPPIDYRNAAIARNTGAGVATSQGIERDLATLSYDEIIKQYGNGQGNDLIRGLISQENRYSGQNIGTRSGSDAVADSLKALGMGFGSSLANVGVLGAGLVNDRAGVAAADALGQANEWVQGTQSPALQARREAAQSRSALVARDNAARRVSEEASGTSPLMAKMKEIGRNLVDTGGTLASDPMQTADVVSQGVGSLFAAGPLGRGMAALGAARSASTALGIGAMEAGGSYQQTAVDISRRSFDELSQSSPMFRDLVSQGMEPEAARTKVAARSALMAAAITAPAAVATGKLVSRFESAPLRVPNAQQALGNIGRETLEEGVQGGLARTAQNIGTQQYADENQSLTEGVGEEIATGAVGGLGAAGVVQAPGTAMAAVRNAGRQAMNVAVGQATARTARTEAASPVSPAAIRAVADTVAATAPEAEVALRESVAAATVDATPEVQAKASSYVDNLMAVSRVDEAELAAVPESMREVLAGSTDRLDAVSRLAATIAGAPETQDGKLAPGVLDAAMTLMGMKDRFDTVLMSDMPALRELPPDSPAVQAVEQFMGLASNITQIPQVKRAIEQATGIIVAQAEQAKARRAAQPLTEQELATPQGQQDVQTLVAAAGLKPDQGDIELNKVVLAHATAGRLTLSPAQRSALMTSNAILEAARAASDEQERLGHKKKLNRVSDEVQVLRRGSNEESRQSAVGHATRVMESMRAGNTEQAADRLAIFGEFVTHMQNKVEALNKHFAKGGPTGETYQALDPDKRTWYNSGVTNHRMAVHPHNENSVELAQRIELEAKRLAGIFNGITEAFPELGTKAIQPTSLVQSLQGPISDVAKAFQSGQKSRAYQDAATKVATPKVEVPAAPKVAPKVEAKAEPKTEAKAETKTEAKPKAAASVETVSTPVAAETATDAAAPKTESKVTEVSDVIVEPKDQAPKLSGIDAAYPNLLATDKITNFFKLAFKLPEKQRSRLTGEESPLTRLMEAFQTGISLARFTGKESDYGMDSGVSKALRAYLASGNGLADALNDRLQSFLKETNKAGGPTLYQQIMNGGELNRWVRGKPLNITKQDGDTLVYNRELLEGAVLAGLQWLETAKDYEGNIDGKSAAAMTGIPEDQMTNSEGLIKEMEKGLPTLTAKRLLAQKIKQFWGLSEDTSVPVGYTEGIAEAMAAEILEVFVKEGDLKSEILQITEADGLPPGKDMKTIQFLTPALKRKKDDPILANPSFIERAVLVEPEGINYFGEDRPPVAKTQLRSPLVQNTDEQKAMIEAAQNTPFYLHLPMVKLYEALTLKSILDLFGAGADLETRVLNKNDRKSQEGMNRSVTSGFNALQGLVAEASNLADKSGVEVDQLPIHYAYNVTRVGRLQMLGAYNPQSTKLVREAVLPTRSTVDLSSTNSKDYDNFMLGLAQALGVKVHKKMRVAAINEVEKHLAGKLAPSIDLLRELQETGQASPELAKMLKENLTAIGEKPTTVALHAMVEFARYQAATPEQRKAFTTSIYVEADGVTNGPINAMMLLSSGSFTQAWVNRMAKGGLFFRGHAGGPKTMNEQHGNKHDTKDMYETTTDNLSDGMRRLATEAADRPQVKRQLGHMKDLLDLFLPDFSIEGEDLVMKRGIAKNPLTITIYGSGEKGIAGNVSSAMVEALYEAMSLAAQRQSRRPGLSMAMAMFAKDATDEASANAKFARFVTAFEQLTEKMTVRSKKKGLFVLDGEKTKDLDVDPETFTLEPNRMKNLLSNVQHLFVAPLRAAITETVGQPLMDSAKLIQQATQIQGLFQQQMFNEEIKLALAARIEKDPKSKSEGLSRQEQDKILKSVVKKFPLITTGTQVFFPAGSSSTDVNDSDYGRSLSGGFRTDGFVYGPADPGVAGIPFLVIGTGDGQAIQNLATMNKAPTGALFIFDGVNFKLTTLEEDSRKVNRAIYDSWQGNPLQAVAEMFSKSLPNFSVSGLPAPLLEKLGRALGLEEITADGVSAGLVRMNDKLKRDAMSVTARHNAIARVSHSIDQMAAATAPYQHDGVELTGTNDAEIAIELEALYQEELAKLQKGVKTEAAPVTKPVIEVKAPAAKSAAAPVTAAAKPDISPAKKPATYGTLDKKTGVRVLTYTSVNKLVKDMGLAPAQQAIFNQIRLAKAAKDYKVIYGTVEQLNAYAEKKGLPRFVGSTEGRANRGVTNIDEKTIYLVEPSKETLVHELIHAATYETVQAVLDGKESDPELKAAVERLQALMEQFLELTPVDLTGSFSDAVAAIKGHQNQGNGAAALNEFMAWGLANKELAQTQSETKTASSLVQLAKDVLKAIKQLFWGRKTMPKPADDMLSNLLFNTSVLVRNQPTLQARTKGTSLFMSTAYGTNSRLAQVLSAFDKSVVDYLGPNPIDRISRQSKADQALFATKRLIDSVVNNGFPMTPQAETTFQSIVTALATEALIDPNAMAMAQTLYTHVTKTMTVESFMADPSSLEPGVREAAQDKYDVLMGNFLTEVDGAGRSSLLPVFLGLAVVDDGFREVLAKMPLPKNVVQGENTLDGILENAATIAMNALTDHLAGTNKSTQVQQAVDALTSRIQDVAKDRQTLVDHMTGPVGSMIDRANEILVQGMDALAKATVAGAEGLEARSPNLVTKTLAATARVAAAVASESEADKVAQGVMAGMNNVKGFKPITDIINDIIGRTGSNMGVYDLIKLTRSDVQQDRQQFREHLPTVIAGKFSRKLTDAEWGDLFHGMGKTDLAALAAHFGKDEILSMLKDETVVTQTINTLESFLQGEDSQHWSLVQRKSKQLATFMGTGVMGTNLLRNSEAVSRLLGEKTRQGRATPDATYISGVDQLVTLYALKNLSKATKQSMAALAQDEAGGMGFTLAYLVGQRTEETRKAASGRARLNHYKGYIPSMNQEGLSLVVANDSEFVALSEKSYTRVGNYNGSPAEGARAGRKSYYFAPVSARSPFSQGITQNVRDTAGGVESSSGFTTGMTAGRITEKTLVENLSKSIRFERADTSENLMPVFDDMGKVVAYERGIDPSHLTRMNVNTHMAKVIGVWRGRQVEEAKAGVFNQRLVHALHDMYQEDMKTSSGNQSQYLDLFDSRDLDDVQQDAVALMSKEMRSYVKSVYGGDAFYVRRDMFNDAMGYRKASVGDAWTGNTRWSPVVQNQVRSLALSVMGNDAYRLVLSREQDIQGLVKSARQLIIVKSVIVPAANLISNIYQMLSRGVPMRNIVRSMPKKVAEINTYTKNRLREIEAEADLRGAEGNKDVVTERKLKAEIQLIQDGYRRMSIWPLIEAGEFSSISDAGIARDEILLSEGKLHAYIERLTDKLPEGVKTAGRYAVVAKDTALFQGLQKAVEYGDFLGKAIIYEDLTQRQKKSKAHALGRVTEEFVNYDRLPGRFRGYAEDIGLLWFYNFKIRSAKIALSMIRNNPLHVLMLGMLPAPPGIGEVGTPLHDNIFTKGLEGTLGHSMGPGMGFRAPELNPWANLAH
jgi:hypothetical protein